VELAALLKVAGSVARFVALLALIHGFVEPFWIAKRSSRSSKALIMRAL